MTCSRVGLRIAVLLRRPFSWTGVGVLGRVERRVVFMTTSMGVGNDGNELFRRCTVWLDDGRVLEMVEGVC